MKKIFLQFDKKCLEFLVEDFLEKDIYLILKNIKRMPGGREQFFNTLGRILSKNEFWMDQYDPPYVHEIEYEKLITEWHRMLKPLWDKIKKELFIFKIEVLPTRKLGYQQEYGDGGSDIESYHTLKFPRIHSNIKMSFEGEYISFYRGQMNVAASMIDLLDNAPLKLFEKCQYCKKCIIMTRSDKRYCPVCAAKDYQAKKRKK